MSNKSKKNVPQAETEFTIGDVLGKLINELSQIADDIEELPVAGMDKMTSEDMMAFQKIDFSSQKLRDFSYLLNHLAKNNGLHDLAVPQGVLEQVRLEYTTALLAAEKG